jgi:diguanylate cyclase (GGDEF)-like protein/PAS domain S-box-containing protein
MGLISLIESILTIAGENRLSTSPIGCELHQGNGACRLAGSAELMSGIDDVSFQFLAENSIDIICRAGTDMVLRYVSPSSHRVLGWKPEEMTGKRPGDFILSADASFLPDSLVSGLDRSPLTVRMRKKDGTVAWVEIKHRVVCDPATGEPIETVIVIRDTTKSRMLEEQLSALELTDSSTRLSTHRAFDDALQSEWNRTLREGSYLSLLLLDFNRFRQFHDWRQHREGDRCLAKAAAEVIKALRITDFAARYGAEDIAVILPSTSPRGAAKVAEKVQSAINRLRSPATGIGTNEGRLTVSIGIATVLARPGATVRMPEILRLGANNALQKAKQNKPAPAPAFAYSLPED